jgi:hypothetical protein
MHTNAHHLLQEAEVYLLINYLKCKDSIHLYQTQLVTDCIFRVLIESLTKNSFKQALFCPATSSTSTVCLTVV